MLNHGLAYVSNWRRMCRGPADTARRCGDARSARARGAGRLLEEVSAGLVPDRQVDGLPGGLLHPLAHRRRPVLVLAPGCHPGRGNGAPDLALEDPGVEPALGRVARPGGRPRIARGPRDTDGRSWHRRYGPPTRAASHAGIPAS